MGLSTSTITDNLYKEGTFIFAKIDPGLKLKIMRYYHRIYYCSAVDAPQQKHFAYFERELVPPVIAL
jgi:hypothetical protein